MHNLSSTKGPMTSLPRITSRSKIVFTIQKWTKRGKFKNSRMLSSERTQPTVWPNKSKLLKSSILIRRTQKSGLGKRRSLTVSRNSANLNTLLSRRLYVSLTLLTETRRFFNLLMKTITSLGGLCQFCMSTEPLSILRKS